MKRLLVPSGMFVLATFFINPASQATQAGSQQAVSLYNLGLTAYKEGSPESAIIFWKRATDIDSNLTDAQYNLGAIYQSQKRYREAIPRYLEVLRVKPNDPDAHFQLGIVYQETGQFNEAKQQLSAIPPNDRRFPESQNRIGQINRQANAQITQGIRQDQAQSAQSEKTTGQNIAYQPDQSQATNRTTYQPLTLNEQSTESNQTGADKPAQSMSNEDISANQTTTTNPSTVESMPPQTVSQRAIPTPSLPNINLRVIATGFNAPAGLAFDQLGNLYVANFVSNTIDRISPDGSRSQFSAGANLKGPIGLVCDDNGNLYVANYGGGSVARVSPAGIVSIIASGFRKPYYLTLDQEGNLYVSQQEDNSIVRISLPRPIGSKPQ